MKKFSILVAAAAMAIGATAAKADDTLRIGVEGAYPPFSEVNAEGKIVGFDIDIANALCEVMQRKCVMVQQDWDGIIPALIAKKFDAIIASMSITEERKKKVDFTHKYYNTPAKFVGKADSGLTDDPAALKGKKVGVQRGTIHQCFMEKAYPDADLVLYGTQEEANADLAAGRLDAVMADSIQLSDGFLKTDAGKGFSFFGADFNDPECHGEGAGIAVRKGDDALREAFNKAIKTIRENGTYAKINAKYFDFDIYGGGA